MSTSDLPKDTLGKVLIGGCVEHFHILHLIHRRTHPTSRGDLTIFQAMNTTAQTLLGFPLSSKSSGEYNEMWLMHTVSPSPHKAMEQEFRSVNVGKT